MVIAYQGEAGAFSEQAARAFFAHQPDLNLLPCASFEVVFESLMQSNADFAVIPIENSLFGSVHINYDLLQSHDVRVIGEVKLRVVHNLLVPHGETLESITHVYSHWQALGQCQNFLSTHLPHAEVIAAYDTAGAAKMIANGEYPHAAAIASKGAAQEYGLEILAESIESNRQNYTRFLVLRQSSEEKTTDSRLQTQDYRLSTTDSRLQTIDYRLQT